MPGRPSPQDRPTDQSSELVDDAMNALRRHAKRRRRLSLVVYHRDGVASARLDPGVPVVVGRRPPATLCVASTKLSRAHARFTLGAEGRVTVEDLGSTNGTWIGGARIEAAEIALGEEVIVGDAIAYVEVTAPAAAVVAASAPGDAEVAIAVAPAMRAVLDTAVRVAASSVPVILQGETGTGKDVVARLLHARGPRADKPMVCVNCAAIPSPLVESTLFGHEKGAFTGAGHQQKGVFEEADGGTVFLDEIGELPLSAQAVLLRVLETGRFARVGSAREIAVDVRVVAATHRDLEVLRDAGAFRADLYFRLGVMVIALPPLRERAEDVEPLVRRFVARAGEGRIRDVAPEALALLRAYAWPGNVRELRNAVERAVVLAPDDVLRAEDLPARVREAAGSPRAAAPSQPLRASQAPPAAEPPSVSDLRAQVLEYESRVILEALQAAGWNQSEAARRLGMPIRTLSHKANALGLKKPSR